MKKINVSCVEELCEIYNDIVDDLKDSDAHAEIIANYDEAREIIKELIFYGYEIAYIDIADPTLNEYNDEFSICVIECKIWCEKARVDEIYPFSDATIAYFMDDVNHKVTSAYDKGTAMYEVHIVDEEDEVESDISIAREGDDMHGFTLTQNDEHGYSSYSYYSTDTIDGYTLERLLDIFDV